MINPRSRIMLFLPSERLALRSVKVAGVIVSILIQEAEVEFK